MVKRRGAIFGLENMVRKWVRKNVILTKNILNLKKRFKWKLWPLEFYIVQKKENLDLEHCRGSYDWMKLEQNEEKSLKLSF